MASSRFILIKRIILSGSYDKDDLTYKITHYREHGYLTAKEADELLSMME